MPRLKYRIPQSGDRVKITNGDYQGRTGTVASYDFDRSILFVDLDAVDRPWMEPFTLGVGPGEVREAGGR